jgi:hypothetical protein
VLTHEGFNEKKDFRFLCSITKLLRVYTVVVVVVVVVVEVEVEVEVEVAVVVDVEVVGVEVVLKSVVCS